MVPSKVAIIVPAFNEERTIAQQVNKLNSFGRVIVVNDGSCDDTKQICENLDCDLINLESNMGYDRALEVGIKRARAYEYIVTTDADGEIPTKFVSAAINDLLEGADCVLGQRQDFPRYGEIIINTYIYLNYGIKDIFCGLKGYRVSSLGGDIQLQQSVGTRLALNLLKNKKNVTTIPVQIVPRKNISRFGTNDVRTNIKILKVLKYV